MDENDKEDNDKDNLMSTSLRGKRMLTGMKIHSSNYKIYRVWNGDAGVGSELQKNKSFTHNQY